jgi:hypothetical protein
LFQKKVYGQIRLRTFPFGEMGYSILLAGHAGKAWSDLGKQKRHNFFFSLTTFLNVRIFGMA